MDRRRFLGSLVALAAAAVIKPEIEKLPPVAQDIDRLTALMKTSVIEGQTFVFDQPITIAIDNLTIRRCTFVFNLADHYSGPAMIVKAKNLKMEGCRLNFNRKALGPGIEILPLKDVQIPNIQMTPGIQGTDPLTPRYLPVSFFHRA